MSEAAATIRLAAHDHDVSSFGVIEWTLVGLAALIVAWVIWRAVVLTVRPGEDDPNHIKRMILDDEAEGPATEGPLAGGHDGRGAARPNG